MSTVSMSKPAARVRKPRWILKGILLLVVVLSGMYAFAWWRSHRTLKEAVAEAAKDGPWTIEDLEEARLQVSEADNGVLKARTAFALLPKAWPAWPIPADDGDPQFRREILSELQNYFDQLTDHPRSQLDGYAHRSLQDLLKRDRAALAEAHSLIQFKQGRFPLKFSPDFIGTLMPHLQELRQLALLLVYEALDRVQTKQDVDGAVESLRETLHMSQMIGDEEIWISQLVRIAINSMAVQRLEWVLGQGEPSAAVMAKFQNDLQAAEAEQLALYGARGERAGMDRFLEWLQSQGSYAAFRNYCSTLGMSKARGSVFGSGGGVSNGVLAELEIASLYTSLRSQRAILLRYMNGLVEVAKLPIEQQAAALNKHSEEWQSPPLLIQLLAPAQPKLLLSCRRDKARLRGAIAALAAERYRKAHGRWPESLQALVPDYLTNVPADPFDAQPLRYKRTGNMVSIYSVGDDGIDQGGHLQGDQDHPQPLDIGMRLWGPSQRRQAPVPFRKPEHAPLFDPDANPPDAKNPPEKP